MYWMHTKKFLQVHTHTHTHTHTHILQHAICNMLLWKKYEWLNDYYWYWCWHVQNVHATCAQVISHTFLDIAKKITERNKKTYPFRSSSSSSASRWRQRIEGRPRRKLVVGQQCSARVETIRACQAGRVCWHTSRQTLLPTFWTTYARPHCICIPADRRRPRY